MLKKYSAFLLLIIPLIITIFISCNKKEDKMIIITMEKQYIGITQNEEVIISLPLYIENNKKFYLDKKCINKAYLKSSNNEQIYEVEIDEINKTNQTIKYENKDLFAYNVNIKINNCTKEEIRILDAIFELDLNNGEIIKVSIGSLLLKQVVPSYDLNIVNFKGIVNEVIPQGNSTLPSIVGLLLKLRNNSNELITITNFTALNSLVTTDLDQIKILNSTDYASNIDINELMETGYELIKQSTNQSVDIELKPNEEISLLIPLNYLKLETVNELGLTFTYRQNNDVKEEIIESIPLFNSTLLLPNYSIYAFTPSSN